MFITILRVFQPEISMKIKFLDLGARVETRKRKIDAKFDEKMRRNVTTKK